MLHLPQPLLCELRPALLELGLSLANNEFTTKQIDYKFKMQIFATNIAISYDMLVWDSD